MQKKMATKKTNSLMKNDVRSIKKKMLFKQNPTMISAVGDDSLRKISIFRIVGLNSKLRACIIF